MPLKKSLVLQLPEKRGTAHYAGLQKENEVLACGAEGARSSLGRSIVGSEGRQGEQGEQLKTGSYASMFSACLLSGPGVMWPPELF